MSDAVSEGLIVQPERQTAANVDAPCGGGRLRGWPSRGMTIAKWGHVDRDSIA